MQSCVAAMAWLASLFPRHYTNLSLNLLKKKRENDQICPFTMHKGQYLFHDQSGRYWGLLVLSSHTSKFHLLGLPRNRENEAAERVWDFFQGWLPLSALPMILPFSTNQQPLREKKSNIVLQSLVFWMKFPQFSSLPQQLGRLQIFSLSSLSSLHISSRFLLLLV